MTSLVRVPIRRNPHYKRDGLKSYVYLLNKYSIHPTIRGPYSAAKGKKLLIKQNADGTTGEVTATDQQNDSLYTCPVKIGTPGQTLNLVSNPRLSEGMTESCAGLRLGILRPLVLVN